MASDLKKEELKYDSTAKVSSKGTAILGRLIGPCADTINPTRNGRKYSDKLWEKVFQDSLVKEQFANGGIFGEMNHPADRDEVDLTQVCVCMPEPPKKNDKGELIASWDILDTPNGRILKTLCDYGYKLGISSRGTGEIETDYDGNESVDPESYQLNAWDIVLIPAVKSARLQYTTESLDTTSNKRSLKESLQDTLNKASEEDKKIMEETLGSLGIDLNEATYMGTSYKFGVHAYPKGRDILLGGSKTLEEAEQIAINQIKELLTNPWMTLQEKSDYINTIYIADDEKQVEVDAPNLDDYSDGVLSELASRINTEKNKNLDKNSSSSSNIKEESNLEAVDNNEAIVEELKNSIKQVSQLQSEVISLQEKLSVCYAKENSQTEEIVKLRTTIQKLSEDVKRKDALQNQLKNLTEKLAESNNSNLELTKTIEVSNQKLATSRKDLKSLNESIISREHEVDALKGNIVNLNKQIAAMSKENSDATSKLTEELETLKKDSELKANHYSQKLSNANKLVEKYKLIANKAIDKYIESEALKLGVKKEEIKNKLPQTYTFKDIDSICEELRSYKLSISRLPFNVAEGMKMKATQSTKETILPANRIDDEVDNSLMEMAGLN